MNEETIEKTIVGDLLVSLWKGLNLWFAWPSDSHYPLVESDTKEGAIAKLIQALAEMRAA